MTVYVTNLMFMTFNVATIIQLVLTACVRRHKQQDQLIVYCTFIYDVYSMIVAMHVLTDCSLCVVQCRLQQYNVTHIIDTSVL